MKKILSVLIVAVVSLPGLANAGAHVGGYVTITNSGTTSSLSATMNVRYNAAQGGAYVMSQEWWDGTPTFYATNSSGTVFFCYVPQGDVLYEKARDAHNNLGNGSYVYVTKSNSSNVCTALYHDRRSYYLD